MMDISNVVVIVLSITSLLCSICASAGAFIALKAEVKMRSRAEARKRSRVELPLEEIMAQLESLPEGHKETVFLVKGKRIFQRSQSESKNNNKLAV